MKQLDIALDNLADTLGSARQIAFILAGFSIAAVYLVLFGGGALDREIASIKSEKSKAISLVELGNTLFKDERNFYEGSADVQSRTLASFTLVLDRAMNEFKDAYTAAENIYPDARAFVRSKALEIDKKVSEMRSSMELLVAGKKARVSFEDLKVFELKELTRDMRMEPWILLRDSVALKAAAERTAGTDVREVFTALQSQTEPIVKTAPRDEAGAKRQTVYLTALTESGYRSLYEVRTKIAALDSKMEEKEKQRSDSIKLPFMDQPIDASTLAWVIPSTLAVGTLFCVFYVMRARELYRFSAQLDPAAARAKLMYPWVYLWLPEQDRYSRYVAACLQVAVIGAPIGVSLVFLWQAMSSLWLSTGSAAIVSLIFIVAANLLAAGCAAAFIYELVAFRFELREPHTPLQMTGKE